MNVISSSAWIAPILIRSPLEPDRHGPVRHALGLRSDLDRARKATLRRGDLQGEGPGVRQLLEAPGATPRPLDDTPQGPSRRSAGRGPPPRTREQPYDRSRPATEAATSVHQPPWTTSRRLRRPKARPKVDEPHRLPQVQARPSRPSTRLASTDTPVEVCKIWNIRRYEPSSRFVGVVDLFTFPRRRAVGEEGEERGLPSAGPWIEVEVLGQPGPEKTPNPPRASGTRSPSEPGAPFPQGPQRIVDPVPCPPGYATDTLHAASKQSAVGDDGLQRERFAVDREVEGDVPELLTQERVL